MHREPLRRGRCGGDPAARSKLVGDGRAQDLGRLGVIYSNKDYGCEWDFDWRNKRFQRDDNTKFAVNIVSYALTA
jgi:hypothetical protein